MITLPKIFWFFRDKPMSCLDVRDLGVGEKFLDCRDGCISDISGLRTPNKESGSIILDPIRLAEGEIGHVIEGVSNHRERYTELKSLVLIVRANKVCQKELADGKGLVSSYARLRTFCISLSIPLRNPRGFCSHLTAFSHSLAPRAAFLAHTLGNHSSMLRAAGHCQPESKRKRSQEIEEPLSSLL